MAGLIDNVLDFARGPLGGGLVLERQAESLQPLLQQVVDELQSAQPDRVIAFDIALPRQRGHAAQMGANSRPPCYRFSAHSGRMTAE